MSRLINVLVVDDEALARSRLRTLLNDCRDPPASVVAEAGNAVQAMHALQHSAGVDVVLLDIHMPGVDGMVLAESIRQLPDAPAVVFVTAHPQHAVAAFDLDALDYLTKPVRLERLQAALQKVQRLLLAKQGAQAGGEAEMLVIQDRGNTERLPLADVLYFKAELKYVTVRTASRNYILDGSLSELEERYATHFLRVHRNALVARRAIRAIEKYYDPVEGEGWAVRLAGLEEELVAVSRRQLSAVRAIVAG
jgi:two-component system, LytTR family, response regulator AlgR